IHLPEPPVLLEQTSHTKSSDEILKPFYRK
nr:hypothetical protein [Tanacetum cinerariifolium]